MNRERNDKAKRNQGVCTAVKFGILKTLSPDLCCTISINIINWKRDGKSMLYTWYISPQIKLVSQFISLALSSNAKACLAIHYDCMWQFIHYIHICININQQSITTIKNNNQQQQSAIKLTATTAICHSKIEKWQLTLWQGPSGWRGRSPCAWQSTPASKHPWEKCIINRIFRRIYTLRV